MMGRRKIEICRIDNDRKRSVTFNKRKLGLIKKASELAVLCDCDVGLLIHKDGKMCQYASSDLGQLLGTFKEHCDAGRPTEVHTNELLRKANETVPMKMEPDGVTVAIAEPFPVNPASTGAWHARTTTVAVPSVVYDEDQHFSLEDYEPASSFPSGTPMHAPTSRAFVVPAKAIPGIHHQTMLAAAAASVSGDHANGNLEETEAYAA